MKEYHLYTDLVGILLILYSALVLALIIERSLAWRRLGSRSRRIDRDMQALVQSKPTRESVAELVEGSPAPLARVMGYVLKHDVGDSPETTQLLLEDALDDELARMKRNHVYLAVLSGTAPFLGLLGTVRGIMNTFHSIMEHGMGGPAIISAGIAEALQTTAVGLMIAIPGFIAFNILNGKAADAVRRMRMQSNRVLVALGEL